jgi:hypothetical protein
LGTSATFARFASSPQKNALFSLSGSFRLLPNKEVNGFSVVFSGIMLSNSLGAFESGIKLKA